MRPKWVLRIIRILGWMIGLGVPLVLFFLVRDLNEVKYPLKLNRGKEISQLFIKQMKEMGQQAFPEKVLLNQVTWPDDFLTLEKWLVIEWAQNHNPERIAKKIEKFCQGHLLSSVLKRSLGRWIKTLRQISEFERNRGEVDLFKEGQQRYYEAAGYQKIGRQYDAIVLYLWSGSLLQEFIETSPFHKNIPQAVFMIGVSMVQLRHVVPEGFRSDQILTLCSELYSYSIWAKRAAAYWRNEIGAGGERLAEL